MSENLEVVSSLLAPGLVSSMSLLLGESKLPFLLTPLLFAGFVAFLTLAGKIPFLVLVGYCGASSVAFALYAIDKSAARADRWRIPEKNLHILGLLGGWPGALAAQQLLRHKNRKRSFQAVFWLTVLLNCAAFLFFLRFR